MLYGLLITLAINLGWGAWALFGSSGRVLPDWAKPQDILIPATLLPAPTTPPRPRVSAAPEPASPSLTPLLDEQVEVVENRDAAIPRAAKPEIIEAPDFLSPAEPAPLVENTR